MAETGHPQAAPVALVRLPLTRIIHLTFIPSGIESVLAVVGGLEGRFVWCKAEGPLSPNVYGTLERAVRDGRRRYEVSRTGQAQASFTAAETAW